MTDMFDVTKVKSVYSGRKGCACGCKGKYTYAAAGDRPSYYEGDEGVSPRGVAAMVRKIERIVRDGSDVESVMIDPDWFAVDMDHDRTYTVYFAEEVRS